MHNAPLIHGHEVMQMMLDSGAAHTRDSLRNAIHDRFGPDARFFTCSAANLTAEDLIEFLAARDKFVTGPAGFTTDPSKLCRHDDGH